MKISIGSKNPRKIESVEYCLKRYKITASFIAVDVSSGVSAMPMTKDETRRGAWNRADASLRQAEADLGVGLEGGLCQVDSDYYLFATTCVTDGVTHSFGGEVLVKLPYQLWKPVIDGEGELGDVLDRVLHQHNTKQSEGAVGYLTGSALTRKEAFDFSLLMAIAPYLNRAVYEQGS